jgi:tetratricopeptide (TPR) repeat protein
MRLQKLSILLFLVTASSFGATPPIGVRIDNVPMYGQPELVRPEVLKRADEEFIAKVVAGLGSREKASQVWYAQAEEFMQQGNFDLAMRRYNQSWLLNPNNYQPYWGFGRVMLQQRRCDEAITHFTRAKELATDQYQRPALLSDFGIAYGYCGTLLPPEQKELRAKYFETANILFTESTELDPTYGNAWLRWSQLLLEEDRPADAWEKLKRARSAGVRAPTPYLERLSRRMPEPQ